MYKGLKSGKDNPGERDDEGDEDEEDSKEKKENTKNDNRRKIENVYKEIVKEEGKCKK